MEPFLTDGEMAGKIVCPNKKCGAKLGNFDWAGVRCSCKAWVVPASAPFLTSLLVSDLFRDLGRASVSIVRRLMKWWSELDADPQVHTGVTVLPCKFVPMYIDEVVSF